jgi:hypothetical protein
MNEDEGRAAPRPYPAFRVYVIPDSDKGLVQNWITARIDVTHAVMDVYDIAVGSMDLRSGFLSTEEVGNLRALGKAIGAESFDYQHDKCLRCGHDYQEHAYGGDEKKCRHYRTCKCTGYAWSEGTVL